jgi:ABC-2 type transport system permease protein
MADLMKYRFFTILREKQTMFWGFVFPLILCTLFYVSFGNIDHSLDGIKAAAVIQSDTADAQAFTAFLQEVEKADKDFISVETLSEKKAKQKLRDGKISGIYYADTEPELCVAGSGVEESVLQALLESYQSRLSIIQTIAEEKPEKLPAVIEQLSQTATQTDYVKEASLGGKETDGFIQYFFSLIAMTCMFGCFLGFDSVLTLQANISHLGARRCVGATSKATLLLIDFGLISVINFAETVVLIAYMTGVLKLDLGGQWGRIFLISFLGCLIGVSMGILIGSVGKWNKGTKIGIMLCISLGSSFLSGLMVNSIKGWIEEVCPVINQINPSSLITDAFYSIAVYQDTDRYLRNAGTMAILAILFLTGSFFSVRRVRYDSL